MMCVYVCVFCGVIPSLCSPQRFSHISVETYPPTHERSEDWSTRAGQSATHATPATTTFQWLFHDPCSRRDHLCPPEMRAVRYHISVAAQADTLVGVLVLERALATSVDRTGQSEERGILNRRMDSILVETQRSK